MGVLVHLADHRREPTRQHDEGMLRVIGALERSGIAVVTPGEHEDAAIERMVRKSLPVSPRLQALADRVGTRTEAEARALHPIFANILEPFRP